MIIVNVSAALVVHTSQCEAWEGYVKGRQCAECLALRDVRRVIPDGPVTLVMARIAAMCTVPVGP